MRQLAALNSRLASAQEMVRRDCVGEVPPMPWRTVVGAGIAGEAKLDHLRLVSLGMRSWQDFQQYGLRIWFTDPDTGSILHLSRSWPRSEQENAPAATRRLFTFQAGALAGGQIVSQAAKRSAEGELLLGTRNRLSSVVPLSPDAWQMLSAPLRQPGIVALREYLRQRPPVSVRPLNQVDNLFILPVAECISLGWDSSRQTLDAQVISGEGEDNMLTLSLPASASSPFAVERMAALLQQTDDPVSFWMRQFYRRTVNAGATGDDDAISRLGAGCRNCVCGTATFRQRSSCAVHRSSVVDALPVIINSGAT